MELVNRSEELRNRAFNVIARKHRNWQGCCTLTQLALEAHTIAYNDDDVIEHIARRK